MTVSPLQHARYDYKPKVPGLFRAHPTDLRANECAPAALADGPHAILDALPLTGSLPIVTFGVGEPNVLRRIRVGSTVYTSKR